ncbi:ATP-dependent Clp protease proteolytic subunit [Botrimarina colliarenosi]|uniref:ATP-dependent Clp protease proteolytic subunit n=1 Tax=Botrimarina colliarenosi TaxID=2528001 RepID=A0A5C6AMN0_9BACT|nr:ATP-dependent Clp protease proteolytic subunit [Botrimarina colliarenosi]TWU00671.1 ATP-dependent Clp protease proteolytic subunit [Botrimarina colliarenosi]
MKTVFAVLGWLALVLLLLASIGISKPASDLAEEVMASAEYVGGVEYLAEPAIDHLIDRLNESGYNHQPIDPNEPLLKSRIVLVCEGMNERVARHVVERLIYLDALDPARPIDLRIATSGGWVDSAFTIVDTMRAIEAPVNVTAIGGCYSAGTVILAAATGKRAATPNTLLSVHVNDFEPGDDFDVDRRELDRFRDVYRRYTDVPESWFDGTGDNQWYLNAEQALKMELIDEIAQPVHQPAEEPRARPRAAA